MAYPLMPKATAVWLVENTSLTFEQIAAFSGLHQLEVQGIADGEVAIGIQGLDPTANSQLAREEIERCQDDPTGRLQMIELDLPKPTKRTKGPRYTPVAKRQDKPDGISWLARHHPELKDSQIAKLIGTTKTTIQAVRERTHWNAPNIRPRDPVLLGLCTQGDLNLVVERAQKAAERILQAAQRANKAKQAKAKTSAKPSAPEAPVEDVTAEDVTAEDVVAGEVAMEAPVVVEAPAEPLD